ncbi:MAG: hypothetical protein O3C40_11110 [Planctomycetota bacterium]|nr:hypothetical protein [Planctomycetota bacterium]
MLTGKMLILGGTAFIGRAFTAAVVAATRIDPVLLNRNQTNRDLFPSLRRIVCDRNDAAACQRALDGSDWDFVVDFSGHTHNQMVHVLRHCRVRHYTYLSSSAVDLSWEEDPLFDMARHKLWCEHLVRTHVARALIVRSGFVVGPHDYTERFELRNEVWVWRGTDDPVRPVVTAAMLAQFLLTLLTCGHTEVARCGY